MKLINCSTKKFPNIDMVLVLKDDISVNVDIPPFQYNSFSKRFVKKKFDFDLFVGFENDQTCDSMISFFSKVKGNAEIKKGLLKLRII